MRTGRYRAGVLVLGLTQTIITFQGTLSSWWTRIVIGALVLIALGLDSVVDTTGTLIGLVPLFAPNSEPHDEHH